MHRLLDERQLETYRETLKAAYDPSKTRICVCGRNGCA